MYYKLADPSETKQYEERRYPSRLIRESSCW